MSEQKTKAKSGRVSRALNFLVGNLLWITIGFVVVKATYDLGYKRGLVRGLVEMREHTIEVLRKWEGLE